MVPRVTSYLELQLSLTRNWNRTQNSHKTAQSSECFGHRSPRACWAAKAARSSRRSRSLGKQSCAAQIKAESFLLGDLDDQTGLRDPGSRRSCAVSSSPRWVAASATAAQSKLCHVCARAALASPSCLESRATYKAEAQSNTQLGNSRSQAFSSRLMDWDLRSRTFA